MLLCYLLSFYFLGNEEKVGMLKLGDEILDQLEFELLGTNDAVFVMKITRVKFCIYVTFFIFEII